MLRMSLSKPISSSFTTRATYTRAPPNQHDVCRVALWRRTISRNPACRSTECENLPKNGLFPHEIGFPQIARGTSNPIRAVPDATGDVPNLAEDIPIKTGTSPIRSVTSYTPLGNIPTRAGPSQREKGQPECGWEGMCDGFHDTERHRAFWRDAVSMPACLRVATNQSCQRGFLFVACSRASGWRW